MKFVAGYQEYSDKNRGFISVTPNITMRYLFLYTLVFFLLTGLAGAQPAADLIFHKGYIYTADSAGSVHSAVAVKDGKILITGSDEVVLQHKGENTQIISLEGKLLLPGFIDSHAHSISAFKHFFELNLYGLKSVKEIQDALKEYYSRHPGAAYIKGRGWSNTMFPKTGPDHTYLDEIISHIPVVLASEDGHSRWVNKKALELAGITNSTPAPAGGIIELDPESGEPTGTLRESAAGLVSGIIPPPSFELMYDGLIEFQKMAAGFGITGVHEASIDAGSIEPEVYRKLETDGNLNMRVTAALYIEPDSGRQWIEHLTAERSRDRGELFSARYAKLFADGVVEGSTAFLHEPYNHLPANRGELLCNFDSLRNLCAGLEEAGFGIHVHAIGDAAITATLDAFAHARKISGKNDTRNLITHLQLVRASDIPRFKELNVTAAVQPFWFIKDEYYHDIQVPYLGQERADREYPLKSFFENGVNVASSSDYPVTIPPNPLVAIQTGITRKEPGSDASMTPLWPEESATIEQMIRSYTINAAYASGWEKITGSIEPGKSADLIILDKNLFAIPADEITSARIVTTMFRGKIIYSNQ
ncbi:MAG: amidohydrolase [Ignavibacteriaceae bacterium]|nr:amidohydrolase [Ignavibacteriaceae bacterium]